MKLSDVSAKLNSERNFKEDFIVAAKEDNLDDFIQTHQIECTKDELISYVKNMGKQSNINESDLLFSIFTFGINCKIEDQLKNYNK